MALAATFFTYWTVGPPPFDRAMPCDTVPAWRAAGHALTVHGDDAVIATLAPRGAHAVDLFRRIRIPACRSDLARLLLLQAHGGVYVDAHAAPGAPDALARLLDWQRHHALVLFDESGPAPAYRNTCIINGVMAAQAGSPVLAALIDRALRRLQRHSDAERRAGGRHVRYNIYKLTGPWMVWHALYQRAEVGARLNPQAAAGVAIWPFEPDPQRRAVHLSRFAGYKQAGAHWTERQTREPLFDHP